MEIDDHLASFTPKKSLGAQIDDVDVMVDPADLELDPSSQAVVQQNKVAARNMAVFQEWAARQPSDASKRISFHFWTRPTMIIGGDQMSAAEIETNPGSSGVRPGLSAQTSPTPWKR